LLHRRWRLANKALEQKNLGLGEQARHTQDLLLNSDRWTHRNMKLISAFLICSCLAGCIAAPPQGLRVNHPTPYDLQMAVRFDSTNRLFHVAVSNTSRTPVWMPPPSVSQLWVIREGERPVVLFRPTLILHGDPMPTLAPGNTVGETIPIQEFGVLSPQSVSLRDSTVFLEMLMGRGKVYSNAIKINEDITIDRSPTTKSTLSSEGAPSDER
jgi:hypothetical protein